MKKGFKLIGMRFFAILFLLPLVIFSKTVVYKVYYGFFPAGRIEIEFNDEKVLVKGHSEGIISWFYHYKLFMEYDLNNPQRSYLVENENGKKKFYNFKRILEKKAWLPLVVNILLKKPSLQRVIKVGNYTVILKGIKNGSYHFLVKGSKRTKSITVKGWGKNSFPERIEIDTTKGDIILEKLKEDGM